MISDLSTTVRILVAGDRNWTSVASITGILDQFLGIDDLVIIQGGARGADRLAKLWAISNADKVSCITINADWNQFGRAAGAIRNRKMLDEKPDLVIIFHDNLFGSSKGSLDMYHIATKRGVPVVVYNSAGAAVHSNEHYRGLE